MSLTIISSTRMPEDWSHGLTFRPRPKTRTGPVLPGSSSITPSPRRLRTGSSRPRSSFTRRTGKTRSVRPQRSRRHLQRVDRYCRRALARAREGLWRRGREAHSLRHGRDDAGRRSTRSAWNARRTLKTACLSFTRTGSEMSAKRWKTRYDRRRERLTGVAANSAPSSRCSCCARVGMFAM